MTELLECLFSCDLDKLKVYFDIVDVNCVIPGTDGCRPLHVVAGIENFKNKENVISFLIDKGADPNARSYENLTPVHIAAMWDNCYQLEKLLQNGGNPWLTDNENKNSFDMAADNRAYEAFQLLNRYLAEDKLHFKIERCLSPSSKVRANFEDSKLIKNIDISKSSANTLFLSANENFPLILSSFDDSNDFLLNVSNCIKKKISKTKTNKEKNILPSNTSDQDEKCIDKVTLKCAVLNNQSHTTKQRRENLNQAYCFSFAESETSDKTCSIRTDLADTLNENIVDADEESGIALVECKNDCDVVLDDDTSICSTASCWKSFQNENNSDSSTLSYCSTHSKVSVIVPEIFQEYSNSKIYQELLGLGDDPGPVLDHTRQVYLLRLARLMSGCTGLCDLPKPKYCREIYQIFEIKSDIAKGRRFEKIIAAEFEADSGYNWREGNQRCCFNYLLLDPRITQNLPLRAPNLSEKQSFLTFLDALFYVGKGSKGRPYSHLIEAAKAADDENLKSQKISHILDIWKSGNGVISLHCFHSSKAVEAYTREACIIEAVGLNNLTNIKKGNYYGSSAQLQAYKKRLVGISLLDKAYHIFLLEGERQIKLKDIRK